jgi:hypothetical protein
MKKIVIITFLIFGFVWLFIFLMRYYEGENYENIGGKLISEIEVYKLKRNRLPDNLNDLGISEPMNEGPYYERIDSLNYIVYFNIGFDEYKVYFSGDKKWNQED